MRDERAVITMDLVLENMKKELKRIGFCMACIYGAILILLCGPFLLTMFLGFMIGSYEYVITSVLCMLFELSLLVPFAVIHAIQIIRRIRIIRNPDFTISTRELLSLGKRFNVWFFLFSIEHLLYPPWLVLIRAFQYVMEFAGLDDVYVEKQIADYSFAGDKVHLILHEGKVVGVYNARLYRREDEAPISKTWD